MFTRWCARVILTNSSCRRYSAKPGDVRVRFAPSPTGFLHLGGLRTALYNYLFAKKHRGKFILRIEDTDQVRVVQGAAGELLDDLQWAGIVIDEGPEIGGDYGPYIQSQRLKVYEEHIKTLLEERKAYMCFCTERRLELLRKEAIRARQVPKYDNRCRHLRADEVLKRVQRGDQCCIRFKLTHDCQSFEDLIYGNIEYNVAENEGDPVIMKSDGYPTYHFANVVDDHTMKISHVLRGVEWQISTTKHILLYRALNWNPPQFGHLPLLLNSDGSKLSKRQGDIQIAQYRRDGVYPLALINYITNSGGGFRKEEERGDSPKVYMLKQLVKQFDVSKINAHSGKLSERMLEFNRLELKRLLETDEGRNELVTHLKLIVEEQFKDRKEMALQLDDQYVLTVLRWAVPRITRLRDLVTRDLLFLWTLPEPGPIEDGGWQVEVVKDLNDALGDLDCDKHALNSYLRKVASSHEVKFDRVMRLLRMAISGLKEGPSVAEMIEILGKENTTARLKLFLRRTNSL